MEKIRNSLIVSLVAIGAIIWCIYHNSSIFTLQVCLTPHSHFLEMT